MTNAINQPFTESSAPREARVLLVDDDRELCQMLTEYLSAEHFEVKSVHDGGDALAELRAGDFEILILDVMLPSVGGFDVLRKLGASYHTPVLMLTARGEDVDRIVGLELGADDYLAKPFNPRELLARIKAILRRSEGTVNRGRIEVNGVALDPATRQVHTDGQPIELTTLEFDILEQLMRSAGRELSRDALMESLYGRNATP